MADGLASLLPRPPPPSLSRREAAVAAALSRFDRAGERPAARRGSSRSWCARRPQLGAAVAACLLLAIGLPLALVTEEERRRSVAPPGLPRAAAPVEPNGPAAAGSPAAGAAPEAEAVDTSIAAESAEVRPAPRDDAATPQAAEPPAGEAVREPSPIAAEFAAAPPPAPPPPPAAEPELPSPIAPPPAPAAAAPAPGVRSGAVRGFSVGRRAAVQPGAAAAVQPPAPAAAFSACTIADPARSLAGCAPMIDPAAPGRSGRSAARIADGLRQAWDGDLDGARQAFDAAIAADPRSSLAYLNRALVAERRGDLRRAEADLARATELAPGWPQARHHLERVRRQRGASGADQDK